MRTLRVLRFVETKNGPRASHQNGSLDQVRLFHHQVDRFLLRFRQRPRLEYGAARTHEVEEAIDFDVRFEKCPVGRLLVDIAFLDVNALLLQKTSGVAAGRSGGFPEEGRLRHRLILESTECSRLTRSSTRSRGSRPTPGVDACSSASRPVTSAVRGATPPMHSPKDTRCPSTTSSPR